MHFAINWAWGRSEPRLQVQQNLPVRRNCSTERRERSTRLWLVLIGGLAKTTRSNTRKESGRGPEKDTSWTSLSAQPGQCVAQKLLGHLVNAPAPGSLNLVSSWLLVLLPRRLLFASILPPRLHSSLPSRLCLALFYSSRVHQIRSLLRLLPFPPSPFRFRFLSVRTSVSLQTLRGSTTMTS